MKTSGMRLSIALTTMSWTLLATAQRPAPVLARAGSASGNTPANVATVIKIDPTDIGRTFYGVGAISGGGGNSRLLIDYPVKQRNQIIDYLFKPGYGASLQILKLEVGGDANSTDGSEPSVEHTRGVVNCNAGYESADVSRQFYREA